jgi:nickel-type superoxide dismutase maturation protease
VLGWFAEHLPLARFVVADTSMRPTFEPRDRVLVLRWLPIRQGDVVVARDPEQRSFLLKRVGSVTVAGTLVLVGDSPNVSRDSRHFGPVPRHLIEGRVVFRYLPASRRGLV